MYPVAEGDILKKVFRYELSRKWDTLSIEVEHLLTGRNAGRFHAAATVKGEPIDADFWGVGATEAAALRDLLAKVKGIPFPDLIRQ
jgi:hypothetical protein